MARIDALDGRQRRLIEETLQHFESLEAMAQHCSVHPRTLRDWRREKHRMSHEALRRVCEKANLPIPESIPVLTEFWHIRRAASLGGKRRSQLYGPPGTLESRRKGGLISSRRFRENPSLARSLGFILRKVIKRPKKSAVLAEFIGIMLGDGCLHNKYQVSISFNSGTDRQYGVYLQQLFKVLFGVSATLTHREGTCEGCVTASSRALVEYLEQLGLVRGKKVRNQVDVPSWMWSKPIYQRACLRGLMDTDGSVYRYLHWVHGGRYQHFSLSFTNRSQPLLRSVERMLRRCGFRPRTRKYQVSLYRQSEILGYFQLIGSKNQKHLNRIKNFLAYLMRRGTQVDDGDRLESD